MIQFDICRAICGIIEIDFVAISSIVMMLLTLFIAIATWRAARSTERTSQAQILIKFMEEYRSTKMLDALTSLRSWKDNPRFDDYMYLASTKRHDEINEARRFVKSYFFSALELYEGGFVNDYFMRTICQYRGIEVLFDIVEPLEYSLSDFLDAINKSATESDSYQYLKYLEPDFKRKFAQLRKLKEKYQS